MPRPLFTTSSLAASALFIAATLAPAPVSAQGQLPRPGQLPPAGGAPPQQQPQRGPQQAAPAQQQQQPQVAPAGPYKVVTINAPAPIKDPSFDTFRQQVGEIAKRKDRAALGRLVVAQGFFWEGEKGDKADKRKPGIDNLAAALDLNAKDGSGWETLAGFVSDPTGTELPQRKGVVCSPAEPVFDEKQFEELVKSTSTEESDWGYTMQAGVEVRGAAQPNAPVIEKLGMQFVRVMPLDDAAADQQNPMLRVVTPSGKVGFVPADAINPLGNDQICYLKDGSGWKIAGFIGGGQ